MSACQWMAAVVVSINLWAFVKLWVAERRLRDIAFNLRALAGLSELFPTSFQRDEIDGWVKAVEAELAKLPSSAGLR